MCQIWPVWQPVVACLLRRVAGVRQLRHVVDPAAAGEHAVGGGVVRLPERATVRRDRKAADRDPVADDPRREREREAASITPRTGTSDARPLPEEPAADDEREQDQARVPEHRDAEHRAEARPPRTERRRAGRTSSASRTSAAASSWSRISRFMWTSCQTRYGCSVVSSAATRADALVRDALADRVDEPRRRRARPRSARARSRASGGPGSSRSGPGRSRRAAACTPTADRG